MTGSASLGSDLATKGLNSLLAVLDLVPTSKSLVIDPALAGLISALASFSTLKSHGVTSVVWLANDLGVLPGSVVYVASSDPQVVSLVAHHARRTLDKAADTDLVLALAPERTKTADLLLTDSGVLGDLRIVNLDAHFALAGPNISLMRPQGGYAAQLSQTTLWETASALIDLQRTYGSIGRISGVGPRARKVYKLLQDARIEQRADAVASGGFDYYFGQAFTGNQIDHLLLIDRDADPVTPLLTQLTYYGLIDESYSVGPSGVVDGPEKVKLDDELFTEISDLNFGDVGQHLNALARKLQAAEERRHEAQTVAEIRDFVAQLGDLQQLARKLKTHTNIAEDLMSRVKTTEFDISLQLQQGLLRNETGVSEAIDQLKELLFRGSPIHVILRLACLICLCKSGIRERQLHSLYDQILTTYGYEHLETIRRLEDIGLLFTKTEKPAFATVARSFNLNSEEALGELYAGYVPLTARVVQHVLGGNNGDIRLLDYFDEVQKSELAKESKLRKILLRNTPGYDKPLLVVMVIGGVTYAEAAAIRAVAKVSEKQAHIIVASTGMITGRDMVEVRETQQV